jgi:hypothetical protein
LGHFAIMFLVWKTSRIQRLLWQDCWSLTREKHPCLLFVTVIPVLPCTPPLFFTNNCGWFPLLFRLSGDQLRRR